MPYHPTRVVGDEQTVAYIRKPKEGLSDRELDVWEITTSRQQIMDADHEDLLFADELDREDVLLHFEGIHPPKRPGMTNTLPKLTVNYHNNLPQRVTLLNYEWYDKQDPVEICKMAQEGEPVIYQMFVQEYDYDYRWEEPKRWIRGRYHKDAGPLEEHGCYKRKRAIMVAGEPVMVREVVYNPKVAERRAKARDRYNHKVKTKRTKGPLLTSELDEVTRGLNAMLPGADLLKKPGGWNTRRWGSVYDLKQALRLVWTVFDLTAHRQCKEFQELLAKWRAGDRAADTKRRWSGDVESPDCVYGKLWRWLTKEAKISKPRKRSFQAKGRGYPL